GSFCDVAQAINKLAKTIFVDARTRSKAGAFAVTCVACLSLAFSKLILYRLLIFFGTSALNIPLNKKAERTTLRETAFGLNRSSSSSFWLLNLTSVSVTFLAFELSQMVPAIRIPAI